MNALQFRRLFAAGTAGALAAVGLVVFQNLVNGRDGFIACTAANLPGWLVPVVTALSVSGIVWSLLDGGSRETDGDDSHTACRCDSCGGAVLGDWRLCPHCGQQFGDAPDAGLSC